MNTIIYKLHSYALHITIPGNHSKFMFIIKSITIQPVCQHLSLFLSIIQLNVIRCIVSINLSGTLLSLFDRLGVGGKISCLGIDNGWGLGT